MTFYSRYCLLTQKIYSRIKDIIPDSAALASLLAVDSQIKNETVNLRDVKAILKELFFIDWLLKDLGLTADFKYLRAELVAEFIAEVKPFIQNEDEPEPLFRNWLCVHFSLAQLIINEFGEAERVWLVQEIAQAQEPYSAEPENGEPQLLLLHITLNRNVRLGFVPPKEWYAKIDELKPLLSRDALLQLAFTDYQGFQTLDDKYPGFLAHSVTCLDDLSSYCQLLHRDAEPLLMSPLVKPYLTHPADFIKIIIKLNLNLDEQLDLLESHIQNLNDLVAVINFYPLYVYLIAIEQKSSSDDFVIYKEEPCARFIQTFEHLCRFDLSNIKLQEMILHTPRLRSLVGTSDALLLKTQHDLNAHKKSPVRSGAPNFFPQLNREHDPFPLNLDKRILTLGQVINYMQNLEEVGYYTSGNIEFINETNHGHFRTEASDGYLLAIALSHRAFQIWQQLGKRTDGPFEIMECGGGEGDLCFKILEFVNSMGADLNEWQSFAQVVHYTILELSPALVQRQKEKNRDYIAKGVVQIIQDDALKMSHYHKKAHLHLSNELMDMFAAEQITINAANNPEVRVAVPILTRASYEYLLQHHPQVVEGLPEEAAQFKQSLGPYQIKIDHDGYAITAERFKLLLGVTANRQFKGPVNCFLFSMGCLPVRFYPEMELFIKEHDDILIGMHSGDSKIISPALALYAKCLAEKAMVSIVIDYGDSTYGLKNVDFRSYGAPFEFYENLFLISPGTKDVTYDVDGSVLENSLIQYAPQAQTRFFNMIDLLPQHFSIPHKYTSRCSEAHLEKFRRTNFFSVYFISPEVTVTFGDLGLNSKNLANKNNYLTAVQNIAKKCIALNKAELEQIKSTPYFNENLDYASGSIKATPNLK